MQTEATLFTAHVSTHTGVTTFLVPRGKDRSQADVSLTPGVWRCVSSSSLAILETLLRGPKPQSPRLFHLRKKNGSSSPPGNVGEIWKGQERPGTEKSYQKSTKFKSVKSSPRPFVLLSLSRWPLQASRGSRDEPTPVVTSPLSLWLRHPPREHRYGFRLLLEAAPLALPNSEAQASARRGRAEGQEPGWWVPGHVAGSRAQGAPRTRAWPPRRPPGPYPQNVVALGAAARDLDALRGAHGGGRSVRPGRLSAAPPRAPPAWRLRVALGTWHLQQPEPGRTARREIVARQPRPLPRRRQRPLTGAGGNDRKSAAGGGREREKAERQPGTRRLATGPRSRQDLSRRVSTFAEGYLVAAPPGDQRPERKGADAEHAWRLLCFRSCLIRLYT